MNQLLLIFIVAILGLILGRISFFGLKFGYAGLLIIGLVFGHYGYKIDKIITDIGLVMFIGGTGFIAGPVFISNLRGKATRYILIAITSVGVGALLTIGIISMLNITKPLALGVLTGALTSTPGLGAAVEATQSDLASIGYGIAYPFGVIGVILFINLTLKILRKNPVEEAKFFNEKLTISKKEFENRTLYTMDKDNFFALFVALVLGILIGKISIPFINNSVISLGNAGGVLLTSLLFGHLGNIGKVSLSFSRKNSQVVSDFGLIIFYAGTGVSAGAGALEILKEYGVMLFGAGVLITMLSSLAGFIVAYFIFKLNIVDALASVTGAMTSTPGLGTVIDVTQEPNVAASYASTYPIALLLVVIFVQILNGLV